MRARLVRLGFLAVVLVFALTAGPAAVAAGAGRGGGKTCTQNTPGVAVDNTFGWAQWGSWGLPGQRLTYAINVLNYDVGCSSSTFVVSISAPNGFSVSLPASTITLKSGTSAYVRAQITAPTAIGDGDYPLTVTVARSGSSSSSATATSLYKVYSSDTVSPTLYWPNPADGVTVSGRNYNVVVSSTDDHAVQKIELYLDGVYRSTTSCEGVAFECQLFYRWSLSGVRGQHTATFKSYDWLGNVGTLTTTFTAA